MVYILNIILLQKHKTVFGLIIFFHSFNIHSDHRVIFGKIKNGVFYALFQKN